MPKVPGPLSPSTPTAEEQASVDGTAGARAGTQADADAIEVLAAHANAHEQSWCSQCHTNWSAFVTSTSEYVAAKTCHDRELVTPAAGKTCIP